MRFGVLGPLEVRTDEGDAVAIPELKVRALLADLLIGEGRSVSPDRLIDDLWGDRLPRNPANTLQHKVSQLRRVLETAEPGGRDLVTYGPAGYRLRPLPGSLDAELFQALVTRAAGLEDPRERAARLGEALALWRGPALADFADAEFAQAAIARLTESRLLAWEQRAEARLELGEHGALAGELAGLVAAYPLRERLRAAHLRALYGAGRQSEALSGYEELRRRLADELGVDPGPGLTALHESMLKQDPALAVRPRTNLPAPVTGLIGREQDVEEVRARLAHSRLVTLTGPGGVGKTRLALEAAAGTARDTFADGVWLVELSAFSTAGPAALAAAILTTLDIRDDAGTSGAPAPPGGSAPARLVHALRGKRMLLVLDNCEHVIEAVADLTHALLRGVPGLRVLATSREPIGVEGETLHAVPPLGERDAVRLFLTRAAAAVPGFTGTDADSDAVATICRRLDGLPLALELAATRVRVLGVRELAAQLGERFRLLTGGRRDAPARQRTLHAVIDWSWSLLGDQERRLLRRLAVHADGCTLEAAAQVSGEQDVLDVMTRLVDRSLVVVERGAAGARFRLLESIAAFSLDRLRDAAETDLVRDRHARYYLDLAERARPHLYGSEQRQWLHLLDLERANLRAALDHTARRGAGDLALRLVNALAWYWFLRGRLSEARHCLDLALTTGEPTPSAARATAMAWRTGIAIRMGAVPDPVPQSDAAMRAFPDDGDPAGRARAQWFLGFAQLGVGEPADSRARVEEALVTFRELGDRWGIAAALSSRARQSLERSDIPAIRRDGERCAELFDELGDCWGTLQAMDSLGPLEEITGDYGQATRYYREGLRVAEELGLWSDVSSALSRLGRIALLTGDHEQADELHERARRLAAEQSNKSMEEFAKIGLGLAARRRGDFEAAAEHLRTGLDWLRQTGWAGGLALLLAESGFIAEQRGDAATALALHLDGLDQAMTAGDPRALALALEGLAGATSLAADHCLADHRLAARLLGAATTLRESAGAPLPPGESADVGRITARTRQALGERVFDEQLRLGLATPPGELTAQARSHSSR
ncbi:BTAD domain-containing putative transcriptional regulator [Nonomuraea solani]|uniref:BTAD domain-containing putative transcriptional regulator n=1 Tax=Nonomuraea solani TaxID=1144553 RepID=UPI000CDE74F8|nr:BTAD domain-containing putative transcriptional regulator [Nonomuraea solani]